MRTFFLLAALASVASAQPASPARPARIAVVPVASVNIEAQRVDALAQDLAEGLNAELEVEAVGGLDVRRNLRADLPADCATLPSCAAEVAQATGADQILFVVMVDASGTGALQVDSTWVEPSSGKTGNRPSVSLTSTQDADARARFEENATKFLPDAKVRSKLKVGGGTSLAVSDAKPRHFTTPSLVSGGVAVVGLGIGIGFGLSARSKYNSCDAATTCSSGQKDSIRHTDLIADLGLIAALGGAIATGILSATSGEESHVTAGPMENGASVSYVGRF
ncbi:hypothetical protein BH11MYX1_BH11MYX1_37750 [soil metagenome]